MGIDREFFIKQGKRGGKKRARRLTAKARRAIARKAAAARWKKGKLPDWYFRSLGDEDST